MKKLSKKFTAKQLTARIGAIMATAMLMCIPALAADDLKKVTEPIIELLRSVMGVALGLVVAVGALYCIVLGVKFAKAEEPQDREKAKSHLQNAIIGFVLIFVLILALYLVTPILADWVNEGTSTTVIDTNNWAVVSGISEVVKMIKGIGQADERFFEQFLPGEEYAEVRKYFAKMKFTGNVYAMREGEIAFPKEPVLIHFQTI